MSRPAGFFLDMVFVTIVGLAHYAIGQNEIPAKTQALLDVCANLDIARTIIEFDSSSSLVLRDEPSSTRGFIALTYLLQNGTFLEELDATSNQTNEIKTRLAELTVSLRNAGLKYGAMQSTGKFSKNEESNFQNEINEIAKNKLIELSNVFLDSQLDRAGEVAFLTSMRTRGVSYFLRNEKFCRDFLISRKDHETLGKRQAEILQKVDASATEARNRAIDMWLNSLSEFQKKEVLRHWPLLTTVPGEIDLLTVWLDSGEKSLVEFDSTDIVEEFDTPILVYCPDGTMEVMSTSDALSKDSEMFKINLAMSKIVAAMSSQSFLNETELSDEDAAHVCEICSRYSDAQQTKLQELDKLISGLPKEPRNKAILELESQEISLGRTRLIEIQSIFSPIQWRKLRRFVSESRYMIEGPQHDLLNGELGELLKLTDVTKQKLKIDATKAVAFLREQGGSIEKAFWSDVIACFSDEVGEKFRTSFGDDLFASNPVLSMLKRGLHE